MHCYERENKHTQSYLTYPYKENLRHNSPVRVFYFQAISPLLPGNISFDKKRPCQSYEDKVIND